MKNQFWRFLFEPMMHCTGFSICHLSLESLPYIIAFELASGNTHVRIQLFGHIFSFICSFNVHHETENLKFFRAYWKCDACVQNSYYILYIHFYCAVRTCEKKVPNSEQHIFFIPSRQEKKETNLKHTTNYGRTIFANIRQ